MEGKENPGKRAGEVFINARSNHIRTKHMGGVVRGR